MLGGLDFRSIYTYVKAAIRSGITTASLVVTGNASVGGNLTVTGTATVGGASVVTPASTNTLTNKTLTNPANTTQALTDGANVAWDASLGAIGTITPAGSRTFNAPTGLKAGGFYILIYTQDGTGNRVPTFNAVFKGLNGGTMPAPYMAAGAVTVYAFSSDATNLYLLGAPPDLASTSAALGADVALNNTANFFDGPSLTLPPGRWLVISKLTVNDTGAAALIHAKLWDGTTVMDACLTSVSVTNRHVSLTLAGIINLAASSTVKASAKDATNTSGLLVFNGTGTSKDCTIVACRMGAP